MGHRMHRGGKLGSLLSGALLLALAACSGGPAAAPGGAGGAAPDAVVITTLAPSAVPAAGGATVTIDGTGFTPGVRVLFGDAEATSVTVESSRRVRAVVPRHAAGPADVDVRDDRGEARLPGGVRFVDAPLLTFVDPGHLPPEGGTVILHGDHFEAGARVRFGADASAGDAQHVSARQLVAVAGPHAAGAVDVVVTNPDGQQATLPAALQFDAATQPPAGRAPVLSGLSPGTGPETGGTVVTLAGASFDPLVGVAFGGAPATVTAVDAASVTAVAPPHAPGAVDVVVTNPDGQQASLAAAFAYVALPPPPPVLSSIVPASGPDAGGTSVVLHGGGFQPGAAVSFGGAPAVVLATTAGDLTVLAPAHAAGAVDVTVTNPDGQLATLQAAYTYVAAAPPAPVVSGITPASGPIAGGDSAVVAGASFQPGATVTLGGAPAVVTASSGTSLTITTPAHAAGVVALTVTNPDGQAATVSGAYTYVSPAPPAATAVTPAEGPDTGGAVVTVAGSGFAPGAKVTFGGLDAAVGASAAGALTVTTPPHAAGAVDVVVTNPDGQASTLRSGYAYLPPPVLSGVLPASGPDAGGTRVVLAGAGFQPGATVSFGGAAGAAVAVASSSISVTTPAHAAGAVDVVVANPDGRQATLARAFTFVAPPPTVAGVNPASGTTLGGTSVVISGGGFDAGAVVRLGGALATVTARSAVALGVSAPAHPAGAVDVLVTNGDGQSASLAGAYTYVAPPPAIAGVTPASGPAAGGNALVVSGAGFQAGAAVTVGGVAATVTGVAGGSLAITAPAHAAGAVAVVVTNPDGQSASVPAAYTYVAPPPPVVAALLPASGPDLGGTAVTLTGTGFDAGATVTFGGAAAAVTAVTATGLTVTAPAHAAGAVDVVVVNSDGQSSTLPSGFAYLPPPTLLGLSPASGPAAGGTGVTLSGAGLQAGATVTFGGAAAAVGAVTPAAISVTAPPHAAGAVDVVVANPDGRQAVLARAFTFLAPPPPPPAVLAVTPATGTTLGGSAVVVSGSGFDAGATVNLGGAAATVSSRSASALSIVAPAHPAGAVDVTVVNGDGQSVTVVSAFTFVAPAPSLVAVSPASGRTAGGATVTVSGASFQPGAAVTLGGVAATVTASTGSSLTVTAPAHAAGPVAVVVTNPDGQSASLPGAFTYVAPPALVTVAPASGPDAGGTTVTLGGSGFAAGATVALGGAAAAVTGVTATSLTVTAPAHAAGAVDVVVTNPDGQSSTLAGGYVYLPPPSLAGLAPASGPAAGGTRVTLAGAGLQAGATVAFGGAPGTAVAVASPSSISVATPGHAAGAVDVVVTNPDGRQAVLPGGFTFLAPPPPPPAVGSVTPGAGTTLGGTPLVVSGSGFDAAAQVTLGGAPATVSARTATALSVVAPAHAAGAADVVVVNGDGQSGTLAGGFTYVAPPSLAGVSPAAGPTAGGTALTVSGTGFQAGAAVTLGGVAATVTGSTASALSIVAPAHAAGPVAVVVTNPDGQSASLAGAYAYVAPPPPALASVSPASGPDLGGTAVVLAGTGFAPGAAVTFGGAPAPVLSGSPTALTVTAPAHAAGAVDVAVTNPDGQSSTSASGYAYLPPPSVAGLSPASGPAAGGARVTLAGAGFQAGATVSFGGAPGTAVVVASALAVAVTTPAHAAGPVDVVVVNPDGRQAVLGSAFTFVAPPPPPPAVASATPASGTTRGGTAIVVAGTGFDAAAQVSLGGAPASVSARTATSLTVVAPAHAAGPADVTVVNGDGQSSTLAGGYTYVAPPPPAPAVAGVAPTSGTTLGGGALVVTGSNFQAGATVTIGGVGAAVAASSPTSLSVVAPPHAAGAVAVTVTNPDGQAATLAAAYAYVAPPPPPPALLAVSPAAGPDAGGTFVTLSGLDFQAGAAVSFGGAVAVSSTVSASTIVATAPAHLAGPVDVVVSNPDGQASTLAAAFTFVAPPPPPPVLPPPVLAGLLPASGPTAGGTVVALSGAAFQPGAAVSLGGVAVVVASVSASSIAVVTPAHAAGAVDVTVTNPDGQSVTLPAAFGFVPPPALVAIAPASGLVAGGQAVTLSGASFAAGATVTFGGVAAAVGASSASALSVTAPPHAAGAVDVTVTNPDGQAATVAGAFTYVFPAPTLAAVAPASGPTLGGTVVAVTGSGLQPGASATLGGAPVAVSAVTGAGCSITTPAHAAGAVDLVVTNPDGQRATLAGAFTFVAPPPPPPVLAGLAPAQGPTGGGTAVTLTGSAFQQGASVSFGGTAAVVVSVGATAISAVAPAHPAGAADVVVTNPDGRASTLAGAFTYLAPPAVSSVLPSSGPAAGGTVLAVSGAGFQAGAAVTLGGAPAAVRSATATALSVVAPPHAAGAVDLVVTNPDGQSATATAAFTYVAPPALVAVAPATGLTAGGAVVVLTGSGFQPGASVTFGGAAAAVGASSASALSVTAPPHAAGPVDVTVTNPDGQGATLAGAFTYVLPPPTLATVAPASGTTLGGTVVAVTGSGLQPGASVTLGGAPVAVSALTGTGLSFTTPAHGAGAVDLVVTNPDGQRAILAAAFTFVAPAPALAGVAPAAGPTAGGIAVTLTGSAFQPGAAVTFGGTSAVVVSVAATSISALAPAHAAGPVDVVVTNPDGQRATLAGGFGYLAPPAIASVLPSSGPAAGGTVLAVSGAGFQAGAAVTLGGAVATIRSLTATALSVVAPPHAAGAVDLVVTNPDGQSATAAAAFTYVAPPALVAVAPATGLTTGGAAAVLSGTGFQPGASVTFGGVAATVGAATASALPVTAPAHAAGAVDVTVTNPDGQAATLAAAFTYVLPPPALLAVAPASGTTLGGTVVAVSGSGLQAGASAVLGGAPVAVSALGATGFTITTPAHAAGPADLVVTNPDGQRATLAAAFTFVAPPPPPPALAAVSPAQGPDAGGTTVTVTGSAFQQGATVTLGGATAAVVSVGATSITAVTAGHAAGPVEVVVTNPDGQTSRLAAAFTYVAPPVLASVLPASGPVAGGTAVALSGASFQAGASVTVGGIAATVQAVGPASVAIITPPHAAGPVDVVVTNPDGQRATLPAAFTFVAPPALVAVAPASGVTTGGAVVTVTGTGFQAGAAVTLGGAAATVGAAGATSLAVTAPPHAAGPVDVVVTNPDGQRATLPAAFTYVLPPPAVAGVAPATGTTLGGTVLTVTGSGFQAGLAAALGGAPATVGAVTPTTVTLTAPAHAAGPATLTVVNPDGQTATLAGAFAYVAPAPVLAAVSPAQGPDAGGTAVTLTGSAFQPGAAVSFGGTPAAVAAVTATSVIATTPAHLAGAVAVTVTNPDGQGATLAGAFTFVAPPPPPVLASLLPASGSTAGGTAVALSGSGFQAGASVTFGGVPAGVVSSAPTAIAVTAPAHAAGAVDVVVTNPDGKATTLPAAFTYAAPPPPPPALASIAPASGPAAGGTAVILGGSAFAAGATVSFGGVAATVTAASSTSLQVTTPAHAAGAVDVVVSNPDGQSATLGAGFAYLAPPPPPALASIAPVSGPTAGGTTVTLAGTAFAAGATVSIGGAAATVTAATPTSLQVTTPAHAAGAADVTVTNPDGQASTLAGAFTFVAPPPPALASVTPASGPSAGGAAVVLAGTGFASGATVTFGGVPAAVGGVTATAISVTTPAHAAGAADVVVTNPDGRVSSLAAGYAFVDPPPAPALASVTPASGSTAGGDVVTLAGAGFATGATVTFGGVAGTVTAATATSLAVATSAGAAGPVDVVVTNPDGQASSLAAGFTYVAPPPLGTPPLVSGLTPTSGFTVGGTVVTVSGSEFVNPVVWFGGLGGVGVVPVSSTKTSIVVVTPAHAAGAVDVTVQNGNGQTATLAGGFTYVPTPVLPAPVILGLTPASGSELGNTVVVLSGTGFVTGSTVSIGGAPAIMGAVTATTITFTTPGGAAGPVDVTVVNPDRQSVTARGAFTYVAPPPVVNAINVRGSPQAGGGQLLFVGTGLQNTVSVTFGGAPATGLTYDPLRGALTVTVPPSPLGPTADVFVDLVLVNLDGQSTTWRGFHYGNPPVPTSFTPTSGRRGDPLTITGGDFTADATGLRAGLQVSFGGTFATIISKTATEIVVAIPKLNPGTYPIIVINFDSQFGIAPGVFTAPGP